MKVTHALILAAGMGTRLQPYTLAVPKCLVPLSEQETILSHMIDTLFMAGIRKCTVVVGYKSALIVDYLNQHYPDIVFDFVFNDRYATTNACYSLWMALQHQHSDVLVLACDLVFDYKLLTELELPAQTESALFVLPSLKLDPDAMGVRASADGVLEAVSKNLPEADFESTGICFFSSVALPKLRHVLDQMAEDGSLEQAWYHTSLQQMNQQYNNVQVIPVNAHFWQEIDSLHQLEKNLHFFS